MHNSIWCKIILVFAILSGVSPARMRAANTQMKVSTSVEKLIKHIEYMKERNLDSAIVLCYNLIDLSHEKGSQQGLWRANLNLADAYFEIGEKDSAYQIATKLLDDVEQKNDHNLQIETHLALSWFYQRDIYFESAIRHLHAADSLWRTEDPFEYKFETLKQLGTTHKKMSNFPVALEYYQKIKDQYSELLTQEQLFSIIVNEANVRALQNKYKLAEQSYLKAISLVDKEESPENYALVTYNLGGIYLVMQKLELSNEYINNALAEYTKIGLQSNIENCYRVLGAINYSKKNYETAITYLEKGLALAYKIDKQSAVVSIHKNLYKAYWNDGYYNKSIDKLDKALVYYEKYAALKDSIYQQEMANKIIELEQQYESEKQLNKIALLEQENINIANEVRMQKSQRNYLVIVLLLILAVMGVFIYFYYYYRKMNKLLKAQGQRISFQRDKISDQNSKLTNAINTQNKLHSIIAHDLRSPLASISNLTNLLDMFLEDKRYDELAKIVGMLDQKNEQIIGLTDNLLSWARSQTEGVKPLFEQVSFNDTVNTCMELYQPVAADKNIDLQFQANEKVILWADKNMLRTLCRNLINNAIKFTPKGGTILVFTILKTTRAQICVRDSGVGIPKDKISKLFNPDPSKVSSGTEGEKSSGLGLIVCKEFVEAMDGKIWVESEEGKGSCFKIELPLFQSKE